jgi:hypothetical protein
MPLMGWREPRRPTTLVIKEIDPLERWTWHLTGDTPVDVEIRLKAVAPDRTLVTIGVEGSWRTGRVKLAQTALNRLYDLVQTAATL